MDIWSKVTLVLLTTDTMVKCSLCNVTLDQTPSTAEVQLGTSLKLNCTFKVEVGVRYHVNWYFDPNSSSSKEIPALKQYCSHGTNVTISKKKDMPSSPLITGWKLWVPVGVSSVILLILVLVVVWTYLQQRKRTRRENPIYTNMPPPKKQPSPRPGIQMDNQKISFSHLSKAQNNKHDKSPNPTRGFNGKHLRIPTNSQLMSPKT
ncbi:hypothetical protein UPYG_G00034700 [Umbra pygmaea]|uniref:Uncharacterized protein n=1 Tax=Umbra pygmaea TaxID=75934 RepID=A0ABD0YCK7_UMBPY